MKPQKLKCPYCECIEQIVIDLKEFNHVLRKITYYCPSCKNEWAEMKGYKRIGRYYWHNGEHRRIPEDAKRVKVLGGINIWKY